MRTISLLLITLFCYLTANSQTLVEGGQFMDLIMPMNGSVASDASVWGDVKPRWTDNGVEDNGKTIDTGIAEIGSNNIASIYYTLSGTPVAKPNKGLYIEQAKDRKPRKVMVK